MAVMLLLHSALGLRPGVLHLAEQFSALGHTVATPDYYDGHVFGQEADGVAYRDRIGPRALFDHVKELVATLPPDAALVGLSLGAAFAQKLALDRRESRGVALLHHAARPQVAWSGQPVQVHRLADDPWIDPSDVAALGESVRRSGATFEDLVTPGIGHLYTDPGLLGYDEAATRRTVAHVDRLLKSSIHG
jgi:dienelactone hydrolase